MFYGTIKTSQISLVVSSENQGKRVCHIDVHKNVVDATITIQKLVNSNVMGSNIPDMADNDDSANRKCSKCFMG